MYKQDNVNVNVKLMLMYMYITVNVNYFEHTSILKNITEIKNLNIFFKLL